jgi:putative N6-adenine-specific DNA methylase
MMDKDEAKRLYLIMRRVFSPHPGWSVNVFTGMREFEQVYGARADKRRKLTNGGMPCTLYQYFGRRDV